MSALSSDPNWICSQIGAREHYAIPRVLQKNGRLKTVYTDFWAGPVLRRLATGRMRSLAARFHPDLNTRPPVVVSWNLRALGWNKLVRDRAATQTPYHGYIEVGSRYSVCVREKLKRLAGLNPDTIFFTYDTGALEAMAWCHKQRIRCILNQMDPNRVEAALINAEEKRWPGWALRQLQVPEEYFARREQEWALADRIVVNSEFSRRALLQQGVPEAKLVVMPLCYEPERQNSQPEIRVLKPGEPLRVLFLGQVILRKGIQYLVEAARQMVHENIHFDIVGSIGVSREALASAPANVSFHGQVGRNQASEWYRKAHVFVLPTLSDGFAITQLEAMAHGLPVVVTPCCGAVVDDGVNGFVVPAGDSASLANAFQHYLTAPELLSSQSTAALHKAGQFTLDRLSPSLDGLEAGLK